MLKNKFFSQHNTPQILDIKYKFSSRHINKLNNKLDRRPQLSISSPPKKQSNLLTRVVLRKYADYEDKSLELAFPY
ncbi:unnamed protein product [Rhizophagus irregularis]|nr:unnamed protein product [Rhizophagus irregularis]CAB4485024.1 unnamed protein product [Rhizophagus irregularis]